MGATSSASIFPLVKSSLRSTKIAETNSMTTSMNARRIFPVMEIINPVKKGPIALDPLSVIAYNYTPKSDKTTIDRLTMPGREGGEYREECTFFACGDEFGEYCPTVNIDTSSKESEYCCKSIQFP